MMLLNAFATEFWGDFVWTLAHSLWQAALIALLLGLTLQQIPARRAKLRYWLCVAGMLSIVCASFFTHNIRKELRAIQLDRAANVVANVDVSSPFDSSIDSPVDSSTVTEASPPDLSKSAASAPVDSAPGVHWTSVAAIVWLFGISIMLVRTSFSIFRANSLGSIEPLSAPEQSLANNLAAQFRLKSTPRVWTSTEAISPYVVGVFTPAVVVPLSMMSSLTADELKAVLAHEFAHVRRNDYLANLFQMVIESAYFFNPAVWWISQQVRAEREACCDQAAVELTTNEVGYATILADWMEKIAGSGELAPAGAIGFAAKQPGGMLDRIRRIVTPDYKPRLSVSPTNFVFVLAATLLIGCGLNFGSQTVTAIAAKVLTDDERVAVIQEEREKVRTPQEDFEEGNGTIRGKVITDDGGIVERGSLTSISKRPGWSTTSFEGWVDGEFEIEVGAGDVQLVFYSDNYAPTIVGPIQLKKDTGVTQDLQITKGKPHVVAVTNEDGEPLANAAVLLIPFSSGPSVPVMTDEKGEATFPHTVHGRRTKLTVKLDGFNVSRSSVTIDGRTNLSMSRTPVTTGRVVAANGEPVANAEMWTVKHMEGNHSLFEERIVATTDQDGRFETGLLSSVGTYELLVRSTEGRAVVEAEAGTELSIELLPDCDVHVTIEGDRTRLLRKRSKKLNLQAHQFGAGKGNRRGSARSLSIADEDESESKLTFSLQGLWPGEFVIDCGAHRYRGIAKPGSHELTLLVDDLVSDAANEVSDVEVRIRFFCNGEQVKPGGELILGGSQHRVWKLNDGVATAQLPPRTYYLDSDRIIGFTFKGRAIEVKSQATPQEISVEVEPAGAIAGRLVDAKGNPPVSAPISCYYEVDGGRKSGQLANNFQSDANGNFLITPIPLDAKVFVKGGHRFNLAISDAIRIDASQPKANIELKQPPETRAWVKVVDADGKPMEGVPIGVQLIHPNTSQGWMGDSMTNASGIRELSPLGEGYQYLVLARPESGYVSKRAMLEPEGTTVIQLEPGLTLRGKVVDADGQPISKASVQAFYEVQGEDEYFERIVRADSPTNPQGEFVFTRLVGRELKLSVHSSAGSAHEADSVIPGVESEPIVIEVGGAR